MIESKIIEKLKISINDEFKKDFKKLYDWAQQTYNAYCSTNFNCSDYIGKNTGKDMENIVDTLRHNAYIEGKSLGLLWGTEDHKKVSYDEFYNQLRSLNKKNNSSAIYREVYLKISIEIIHNYNYLFEECNNKIKQKFGENFMLDSTKFMKKKERLRIATPILRFEGISADIKFNPVDGTFDIRTEEPSKVGVLCDSQYRPFKNKQTFGCELKSNEEEK